MLPRALLRQAAACRPLTGRCASRLYHAGAQAVPQDSGRYYGAAAIAAAAAAYGLSVSQRPQDKAGVRCDGAVDWEAMKKEIISILEDTKFVDSSYEGAHPGPFFIRLAWHSSGTFCKTTGTGGSGGATMRFEPECSWGANAGLVEAQKLLEPVKKKFPQALSSEGA